MSGAYYELIIANPLIPARFKLTLEDATDGTTRHCEFPAFASDRKRYWVEAKMRAVAGLFGEDQSDGTTNLNPTSQMVSN